ncbi:hypothetical protein ACFL1X_05080 [Candidatus Hydrogenedentota bacterium]
MRSVNDLFSILNELSAYVNELEKFLNMACQPDRLQELAPRRKSGNNGQVQCPAPRFSDPKVRKRKDRGSSFADETLDMPTDSPTREWKTRFDGPISSKASATSLAAIIMPP